MTSDNLENLLHLVG